MKKPHTTLPFPAAFSAEPGIASDAKTARTRIAALYLDSLEPEDKSWLLEALPAWQANRLQALLTDLESTGLSGNPEVRHLMESQSFFERAAAVDGMDRLRTMPVPAPAEGQPDEHMAVLRSLDDHSRRQLFGLLSGEPLSLNILVLRIEGAVWPWQERFMHSLTPLRKRQLTNLLHTAGTTPPALGRQLMSDICHELFEADEHGKVQGQHGWDKIGRPTPALLEASSRLRSWCWKQAGLRWQMLRDRRTS